MGTIIYTMNILQINSNTYLDNCNNDKRKKC